MRQGPFNREAGFLAVLDPTRLYEPKYHDGPVNEDFLSEVVLWSEVFGVAQDWEHPFHVIALAKAYATFKYRLPAHVIVQQAPYLLEPEFTKYGGSAIDPIGGLIVAFSGVQEHFDRQISEMILSTLRGLSIDKMTSVLDDPEIKLLPAPGPMDLAMPPGISFDEVDDSYLETHRQEDN
ncbi:MAG TPA: hypothetical protein VMR75_01630 [Candidatus Saccharimonadales bacterium]|nr:hypothetical protein [Candidatus Saccharimonadales bacterium]